MLIGSRGTKRLEIVCCGSWKAVIGKDRSGADHHAVFNFHAGANVDESVDLAEVADAYARADVRLLADDAVVANPRATSKMDIIPDGGTHSNGNAVFNDRRLVNEQRRLSRGSYLR